MQPAQPVKFLAGVQLFICSELCVHLGCVCTALCKLSCKRVWSGARNALLEGFCICTCTCMSTNTTMFDVVDCGVVVVVAVVVAVAAVVACCCGCGSCGGCCGCCCCCCCCCCC